MLPLVPILALGGAPDMSACWSLEADDAPAWHQHVLCREEPADGGHRWRAWIDRGIGPQGRAPGPDERVHEVAFHATDALAFTLTVGAMEPVQYTFDLEREDDRLIGTLTIGDHEPARVVGTPTPAPEDSLPAWEALPRADLVPASRGGTEPDPGLERREPLQAPADPAALTERMEEMKAEADAVIAEMKAADGPPEARYRQGTRRIVQAMQPTFGPANAWLYQERAAKLEALCDTLGLDGSWCRDVDASLDD